MLHGTNHGLLYLQTVEALTELCSYLIDDQKHGVEYVLLGFRHQDFLEGRFGRYRRLAGGNYLNYVCNYTGVDIEDIGGVQK